MSISCQLFSFLSVRISDCVEISLKRLFSGNVFFPLPTTSIQSVTHSHNAVICYVEHWMCGVIAVFVVVVQLLTHCKFVSFIWLREIIWSKMGFQHIFDFGLYNVWRLDYGNVFRANLSGCTEWKMNCAAFLWRIGMVLIDFGRLIGRAEGRESSEKLEKWSEELDRGYEREEREREIVR